MSRFSLPTATKTPADALPNVNPDTLREFAAGAKEHRATQEPLPWEKFDPDAPPRHNVSVRLNDYQLAVLQYLEKKADASQQKILNRILVPALAHQVKESDGRKS